LEKILSTSEVGLILALLTYELWTFTDSDRLCKLEKKGMKLKKNLLWNYWANLNQTLLNWSLGGPLSKICPSAPSCIPEINPQCIWSQIYALFIEFYYALFFFLFLFFKDMHYNTMKRTFCILLKNCVQCFSLPDFVGSLWGCSKDCELKGPKSAPPQMSIKFSPKCIHIMCFS
jgi:hypothetical protein